MNVHRTASPKTASTTSTTLLRTIRLVNVGLLSPPCDRHAALRPSPAQSNARSEPAKYRCGRWAEQTTPSVPDPYSPYGDDVRSAHPMRIRLPVTVATRSPPISI